MAKRRKPRSDEDRSRKEQIRRAAYYCFQDKGYHKTTVQDICQKAQASKGSFYWHFDTKSEVFIDILVIWAREVISELITQFESALTQEDFIQSLVEAMKREIKRGRAIVPLWLEFSVQARREPKVQQALSRFYRRARTAIAELLAPVAQDYLTEEEIQGCAASIFATYTGLVIQELADPDGFNADEAVTHLIPFLGRLAGTLPNQ